MLLFVLVAPSHAGVIQPTGEFQIFVDPGLWTDKRYHCPHLLEWSTHFQVSIHPMNPILFRVHGGLCCQALVGMELWNNHTPLKRLIKGKCVNYLKKANTDDIATSIQYYQLVRADIQVHKLLPKKFERLNMFLYGKKKAAIHHFLQKSLDILAKRSPSCSMATAASIMVERE